MALFPTYLRNEIRPVRGEGVWLWDEGGKRYLDFTSGLGVCNLGHGHPRVREALENQASLLWHVSNLFSIPGQEAVANLLKEASHLDYAFFANSGAEANEAAIKLARRYGHEHRGTERPEVITFRSSFHGRTLATLTATGQEKVQQGCAPLPEGFVYAQYNDMDSVRMVAGENTVAVLLEIVQGEGGIRPADTGFLKELEAFCREREILLMVDEVQTGMGRTGNLFACRDAGILPDVITCAKGLGNGFPVGVMLGRRGLKEFFGPGSHASTFGGSPLAMAVVHAVLKELTETSLLEKSQETGAYLGNRLKETLLSHSLVKEVRGKGLMWGVELDCPAAPLVSHLAHKGLLALPAGPEVLRLLPPLIVTKEQTDIAVEMIVEGLVELEEETADGCVSRI
ncbi:aspartate aminotransferase family protein [Salinithrix halophila]|uniref:Acetylornithine aminotransferase n=1 Tax=Salinithrix halophila TaxID=1485204 RepID=A0ABV8JG75_9BACL